MPRRISTLLAIHALLGLGIVQGPAGCSEQPDPERPLVVYAAMSLVDVLPPLLEAWTQDGHPAVQVDFASTSRLARQIAAGAPADAFIAADAVWPASLQRAGHLLSPAETPLALNELVVIVPADASTIPRSLDELTRIPGKMALGGPGVPVGRHALQAIEIEGATLESWESTRIHGTNARHVLRLVALGEADIGVVYKTDAMTSSDVQIAFALRRPSADSEIGYFTAITRQSTRKDSVRRLLDHLAAPNSREAFLSRGFLPPGPRG
jgi:molybdate transport system substrate-binding protein